MAKAMCGFFWELMGVIPAARERFAREQRQLTDEVIVVMKPVSRRAGRMVFDNSAAMRNDRIAAIHAPTLILHPGMMAYSCSATPSSRPGIL